MNGLAPFAEPAPQRRQTSRVRRWLNRNFGFGVKTHDDGFIPADVRDIGHLPGTRFPYRRAIGTGLDSNVIMSPVNWIMRNFTEADPVVQRRTNARKWERVDDHPLEMLLQRPNAFYDGETLMKATLVSYVLDGNAYWLKVRNVFGEVVALWYIPHFQISPAFPVDGSVFISHYDYSTDFRTPSPLPVRDVVHFRFGLDPRDVRLGLSPLKPLVREIFTDEEASNFSATILRNFGIPGGLIAPKDASSLPKPADVEAMKEYMAKQFRGDNRGEWLVLGTPTMAEQFGFDPNNLMLASLRDIAEERVCAALGIPAAVVGFGAGLQQTKVGATMRELRRSAWVNALIPMQNSIGKQATMQLIPDFASQVRRFRVRFDDTQVAAFTEDDEAMARWVSQLVEKGVLRVDQAQEIMGVEVDESQRLYLRPSASVAVEEGDAALATDEPEPEPQQQNGGPPGPSAEETMSRIQAMLASRNGG